MGGIEMGYKTAVTVLTALAAGLLVSVTTHDQVETTPISVERPAEPSTSTVWGTLPTTTSTSTTMAPVPTTAPAVERRPAVKPAAVKATTTTLDTVPESEAMGEDFPSPLQVAQSMVGTSPDYAEKGFWCAKAVSDWAEQAGVPNWTSRPGPSALWADAMNDNRVHQLPQVGDMGFADLRLPSERASEYDTQVMHVFIVEAVEGNVVSTIEGNFDGSKLIGRNTRSVDDGMVIAFASFPS